MNKSPVQRHYTNGTCGLIHYRHGRILISKSLSTATQAVDTAQQLMKLAEFNSERISGLKRISGSAHLVHRAMLERPMASPNWVQDKTQLSPTTVNACLRELENIGIIKEITGKKRNRLYSYQEYIDIMDKGTELP